jgi:serine/threonine protein kinase
MPNWLTASLHKCGQADCGCLAITSDSRASRFVQIVKLVDFGMILDLSKEPHSRGMMGSPGFVAPEVILGQHHTSQMDNYSLGVLLFVMLVGAKPMTQEQARSMQYALVTPESLRGMHVSPFLAPGVLAYSFLSAMEALDHNEPLQLVTAPHLPDGQLLPRDHRNPLPSELSLFALPRHLYHLRRCSMVCS